MNEKYISFYQNVHHLREQLLKKGPCQVQKLYTTKSCLCFKVRFKGEGCAIWIGRGGKAEGVLLSSKLPIPEERLQDRFLEFLRKSIKGLKLIEAISEKESNTLILKFLGRDRAVTTFWSWFEGKLYFSFLERSDDKTMVFRPWKSPRKIRQLEGDAYGDLQLEHHDLFKSQLRNVIDEDFICQGQNIPRKKVKRINKFLSRKQKNIERDLMKLEKAEKITSWAKTIKPEELDGVKVGFEGVVFKFKYTDSFHEKRNHLFEKAKAFKNARSLLKKRYEELIEEKKRFLQKEEFSIGPSQEKAFQPAWVSSASLTQGSENLNQEDVVSLEFPFAIIKLGRNAKANDWIRSRWAKKEDLWLHIDNGVSPHVVVRQKKTYEMNTEFFSALGSLIFEYLKEKTSDIDLVYTQVKNLRPVKGSPGKVLYKKEKRIRVNYLAKWKEILANL